jgi:hypothetical protein
MDLAPARGAFARCRHEERESTMFARFIAIVAAALFTTPSASAAVLQPLAATAFAGGDDAAQAPSLSVNPSCLTQGGSATLSYSNPAMAGQTVVIDIDNGMVRRRETTSVEIVLDAKGNGTALWTVPAWDFAKFNAPGVAEVACVVTR